MASAQRLRSLIRPALPYAPRIQAAVVSVVPFSTTSALAAVAGPPPVKSRRDLRKPTKNNYKKKKITAAVGKKPLPGERKAFRKRIQLSNNSALAVEGTETINAGTMATSDSAGRMFAVPDEVVDQLRALEAFKSTQSWGLFRRPHFLVREETIRLMQLLEGSRDKKETFKGIITGNRLSGKSTILLQAMSHALLNQWVVINLPEGQDLTNGQTEYAPIPGTDPLQFTQPAYCLDLLQNIYKANRAVLEMLKIEKEFSSIFGLTQGATLADLVLSAKESEYAWQTLEALWAELTLPGRPPVMLCLDGLAHINKFSEYRDPAYNPVHSQDLSLIRMFVDALSGQTTMPNGGAVLAATSENNTLRHPSQELVISQLEAGQAGKEVPKPDPYEKKYDERVYDALKNCYAFRVDGVSRDEARALMEYWGASGMMRQALNWRVVSEKWALGGHGLVGEMERASLLTMKM